MSTDENKDIVLRYWKAFVTGDVDEALSHVADDAVFFTAGDLPLSGTRPYREYLRTTALIATQLAGPATVKCGEMTAEDDRVCFEMEALADLKNGKKYENQMFFMYRLRDGKIIEVREYADTLHSARVLEGEDIVDGARPRETNLTDPKYVFAGGVFTEAPAR